MLLFFSFFLLLLLFPLIISFPFEIPNDYKVILSWNEYISKSWDQTLSKSFYYKYAGYSISQQEKQQIKINKKYSSHNANEILNFQNNSVKYSLILQFNIFRRTNLNNYYCLPFQNNNDLQSCSDILNLLPLRYISSLRIHFAHRMEINNLWNLKENDYETNKGNIHYINIL